MTAREAQDDPTRPPLETALRHLGAWKHGDLVGLIEYAIEQPDGRTGTILAPLTASTSILHDWTAQEQAHALWRIIAEGIVDPQVSSAAHPRRRHVLLAAFRLPDHDIGAEWGPSLTERFKQLRVLRSVFGDATSTQPMETSWKQAVERLSAHVRTRLDALSSPDDWAPYKPVDRDAPASLAVTTEPDAAPDVPVGFRPPSEGAQKLLVNFLVLTVLMEERSPVRRISERIITAQEDGLQFFTARAFSSESVIQSRTYVPTKALWGCRAEDVVENGWLVTRLWLPQPLKAGEQAHFISEAAHEPDENDVLGWANVEVDHYGIEPGRLHHGMLPVSGLTIRVSFDDRFLPSAVWWYAEQNEQERYVEPPADSPRRLSVSSRDVVKTFDQACQPRENYGIAYRWS